MSDKNLPASLFTPRTFQEAREFAQFVSKTNFVPKDYKDKPDEILACIQYGSEVGLSPLQALQSIAVINGRPSLFGDASLALVMASGLLEYIKETTTSDGNTAICEVKRKGDPEPHVVQWSVADTATAGLANGNVHKLYPKRMRQMRARGFCLRDKFPDILRGLISEDEAIDITPPKEDAGELSPDETPRARVEAEPDEDRHRRDAEAVARYHRVEVKRDEPIDDPNSLYIDVGRQEAGHEEGAALPGTGTLTEDTQAAPNGDYPTAEQVRLAFVGSPLPPAQKFDRIEKAVPDFKKKGYAKLDGPERKAVMEALQSGPSR